MTTRVQEAERVEERHRPALDAPERAVLRTAIRAEIARARPRPVAARTLELLTLAAIEPRAEAPGYAVVDRHGRPRRRGDGGAASAMTLPDLVAELRARQPALFLPPEPDAAVEVSPEAGPADGRDSPLAAGASEMRAATARFVEAQSGRARSLAERSSAQGRALARSAAGSIATLKRRLRARLPRPPAGRAPGQVGAAPDPVAAWNAGSGRLGGAFADGLARLRERLGGPADETGRRHRRWLVGASAAALVAIVAAGAVVSDRGGSTPGGPAADRPGATAPTVPSSPTAASPTSAPATSAPAPSGAPPSAAPPGRTASVPDTVTPPPETAGEPEPEAAPPAPNAITGPVQVIDTATLRLAGKVVRLFGVEWVRGGRADELTRYLAGRSVTCQPAPGSEAMACAVDGRDLSEVVLFNGGGRASPEASPELVAAEDHARSERLGVWKR